MAASISIMAGAKDYLATDFGAKADGETLNTAPLQAAIDYISTHGGGRLILKGGDFVSGTIYIKNDVTLHIEEGARLLGSLNPWDYVRDPDAGWTSFVFAIKQKNIGITGAGEINCHVLQLVHLLPAGVHAGVGIKIGAHGIHPGPKNPADSRSCNSPSGIPDDKPGNKMQISFSRSGTNSLE